jgi:hypothetical protein
MTTDAERSAETRTDAGSAQATSEPITTRGDHLCFGISVGVSRRRGLVE